MHRRAAGGIIEHVAVLLGLERTNQERIMAGLARARANGTRIGRPRGTPLPTNVPAGFTVRQAAVAWGVSKSTAARRLRGGDATREAP